MTNKGAMAAKTAGLKRRTFTREFKLQVLREIEAGKSQAQAGLDSGEHSWHHLCVNR